MKKSISLYYYSTIITTFWLISYLFMVVYFEIIQRWTNISFVLFRFTIKKYHKISLYGPPFLILTYNIISNYFQMFCPGIVDFTNMKFWIVVRIWYFEYILNTLFQFESEYFWVLDWNKLEYTMENLYKSIKAFMK